MEQIKVMPGDVFATANPMALGKAINFMQRLWSHDFDSKYSHTGIIQAEDGTTFEALWTIREGNLFADYLGKQAIIARCEASPEKKVKELENLKAYHLGQWYPFWRLFMHVLPPLAKISIFKRPVCSELTARYLHFLGVRHGQWAGTNPDTLVDEWRNWRSFEIIYEGKIT